MEDRFLITTRFVITMTIRLMIPMEFNMSEREGKEEEFSDQENRWWTPRRPGVHIGPSRR